MHGGTVNAESEGPGKGCTFTVRLPLAAAQNQPANDGVDHTLKRNVNANMSVLVVDDNIDSAQTMAQVLDILGYATFTAHDGLEALKAAERHAPRVVLLDIGLPHLNGHEVAKRIRSSSWGGNMLLIALSGWGQQEDRRRSQESGFDHHFVKPVDLEVLMETVASAR